MKFSVCLMSIVASLCGVALCATVFDGKLTMSEITLPSTPLSVTFSWRYKGYAALTPRLFNAPLPNGNLLVGWTDSSKVGHVSYLKKEGNSYTLVKTHNIADRQVRGIAALSDSSFGVLAWKEDSTAENCQMFVQKWTAISASGTPTKVYEVELKNLDGSTLDNRPTDFDIGDSRMEVDADGNFYVYYHVHSLSGHEGDTYFRVDPKGNLKKYWNWGCSHSMSNLLSYHPVLNQTLSLCVTDCYPGTSGSDFDNDAVGGLYTENKNLLQVMAGGCNGCVGGEIGMVAPISDAGWIVSFDAHRASVPKGSDNCYDTAYNQDIGVAIVKKDKTLSSMVWLTNTNEDEFDPALARYGPSSDKKYMIGWKTKSTRYLGLMDSKGSVVSGPYNCTVMTIGGTSKTVSWGARDDTWRTLADGSVAWLEVSSSKLRVYVMHYGDLPSSSSSSAQPHGGSSSAQPHGGSSSAQPHGGSSSAQPHGGSSSVRPPPHGDSSSSLEPTGNQTISPNVAASGPQTCGAILFAILLCFVYLF